MPRAYNSESTVFSMQENQIATWKRKTPRPYLTTYTNTNLKQINDLNGRPETIKPLEENIDGQLQDTSLSDKFVDEKPKAKVTKVRKWNYSD